MQIKIPLLLPDTDRTYGGLLSSLKQLELSVHHAQKAIQSAEKDGLKITEDSYIVFSHPTLDGTSCDETEDVGSDFYDDLQNIEIDINLQ